MRNARLVRTLLAIVSCLLLVACGGGGGESGGEAADATADAAGGAEAGGTEAAASGAGSEMAAADCEPQRIFMNPKFTGFPYFEVAAEGGQAAADEVGADFTYVGSDQPEVTAQVQSLQNAVTQQPDALVVAAIDGDAVAPVLNQAQDQGAAVVTFDADAATDARDVFVNQLSYELAAQTMLDAALENDPEGGVVAFVAASPTAPNHTAHIENMRRLIEEEEKYSVFEPLDTVQYAEDDEAQSFDVAVNLMQAEPDLKYIISSSAVSVPAAARAVVSQGREGEVYATGFALPSSMQEYVEGGSVKAFALWDPSELGYLATFVANQLACGAITAEEGTTVDAGQVGTYEIGAEGELQYNKPIIFTPENIDQYDF